MINKTAFVGLTHMGQVTSICWAYLGVKVIAIDPSVPIKLVEEEADLPKIFAKAKRNLTFSTDFSKMKSAKTIFFAQDSQLTGINHLQILKKQIRKSIKYFANDIDIVIMSQVPPSFCRQAVALIKSARPNIKFRLYHWVDTIIMTQAVDRILHPERIIIGLESKEKKFSSEFKKHLALFDCPVVSMSYESAEMTKAAINLYLSTSVTYANTLSDYCEATGADINDVSQALRLDKRIGPYAYLRPSLRIAGGHLERDLAMMQKLAQTKKLPAGIVKFILDSNEKRYAWAIKTIQKYLPMSGLKPKIAIWGLAYKKDTDSVYNAPSTKIIPELSKKANLYVYDPMATLPKTIKGYVQHGNKYDALKKADCLLILTEWNEFREADFVKISKLMNEKVIIDCVNIFYEKRKMLGGLTYICMGVGNFSNKI